MLMLAKEPSGEHIQNEITAVGIRLGIVVTLISVILSLVLQGTTLHTSRLTIEVVTTLFRWGSYWLLLCSGDLSSV